MIKNLPKIYYDLSVAGEAPAPVVIPDLVIRLNSKISVADRDVMMFSYFILDGETPEIISHKFYNTMDYHWVVMYINNRFDYIGDFPLKTTSLEKHIKKLYGEENMHNIHHYEDIYGNWVDELYYDYTNNMGSMPTGVLAEQPIWKTYYQYSVENSTDWVTLKRNKGIPVTNYEYEDRLNEGKRKITLIKPNFIGKFVKDYELALRAAI
jgi:hypothetical protein